MRYPIRKATAVDIPALCEIRQQAILKLAIAGMTETQAENWAAKTTIAGIEKRFREAEIWVAEADGAVIAWVAIRHDYIDGLYTDPRFATQGIGTQLLILAESLMRERGIRIARLDSSPNAENFYRRRGYEQSGDRDAEGVIPLTKQLS